MGIRRSLRLQSRIEATVENIKRNTKKNKLPRKRKVKPKKIIKSDQDKATRRSNRIRKQNSTRNHKNNEDKKSKEFGKNLLINNLNISPCEVKLEQIDILIEKLKINSQEPNSRGTEERLEKTKEQGLITEEKSAEPSDPEEGLEEEKGSYIEPNCPLPVTNEGDEARVDKDESNEQEKISKHMMEMLNQYKIQNEIDFDEINSISNDYREEQANHHSWDTEKLQNEYSEKIIKNVFFNNTNVYSFKSCFKDRASLTAAFDRHSGQVSNATYPYDINETPEAEKVKRFYRKNISDPNLHSWYQYNVASSRRFSKQDSDDIITKPYMEKYLVF